MRKNITIIKTQLFMKNQQKIILALTMTTSMALTLVPTLDVTDLPSEQKM